MNKTDHFNKIKRGNIKSCLLCDNKFSFYTRHFDLSYNLRCKSCRTSHSFSFETKLLKKVILEIEDENNYIVVIIQEIENVMIVPYLSPYKICSEYVKVNAKNKFFIYIPCQLIDKFSPIISNRINYVNKLIRNYKLLK